MKRNAAIFLVVAAILAATGGRVSAITHGTVDGNGHPNVGALVAEFGGPGVRSFSAPVR